MIRRRVRIRFRKIDDLRFISHLDLVRTMERMFRRAGWPLGMSEGFHPKPRMSYPLALAVGLAGTDEVMEVELNEERSIDGLLASLREQAPPGLEIVSVAEVPPGTKKAQVKSVTFEVPVPSERQAETRERIEALWAESTHVVERDEYRKPVDVREHLLELALVGGILRIRMRYARQGSSRPRDVLAVLGLEDLEQQGFYVTRTAVELEA